MIIVLASSWVDHALEPRSCQNKTIKLVFPGSSISTQYLGVIAQTGWTQNQDNVSVSIPRVLFQ